MEEFLLQYEYGWQAFIGIGLIILLVIFSYIREKQENKRIHNMQTDQVSLENRTNDNGEVTPVFQKQKNQVFEKNLQTIISPKSSFTFQKKKMEVTLTRAMIDQIRSLHSAGFIIKAILTRFFPEQALEELSEKASKGELEDGMRVRYEDGKLSILSKKPKPI